MKEKLTILFLSAHPDDNILVGGTLHKFAEKGHDVYEMVMTAGESSVNKLESGSLTDIREAEVNDYAQRVGIKKVYILDHSDGFVAVNKDLELKAIKIMREIRPDVIISLHPQDYHHDHRNTAMFAQRVVENAARGFLTELGEKISGFIMMYSDGLNLLPDPDVYVDTSDSHAVKVKAASECYPSQLDDNLVRFVDGLAMARGGRVGFQRAEAFKLFTMPWYKLTPKSSGVLHKFMEIAQL